MWSSYERAIYRPNDTHKLDSSEQASPAEAQFCAYDAAENADFLELTMGLTTPKRLSPRNCRYGRAVVEKRRTDPDPEFLGDSKPRRVLPRASK